MSYGVASTIRKFRGNYFVTEEIFPGKKRRVVKIDPNILNFMCFYHKVLSVI